VARAVGASVCKWCQHVLTLMPEVSICLICDTAPATNPGNRLHAGPPNLPDSKGGWFLPT
jgi:hypothetical protein